ncbi:hypothetical protein [Kitasatospora sp. GAS1066B]|uniref:hypothetical protein n=1 Tax=Kitasatospora sp. GAS1066B TaxID=3156271 RepID=UPI0035125501
MFPDLDEAGVATVGEVLAEADTRLRGLARRLGVRGGLRTNPAPITGMPYAGELYGYFRLADARFGAMVCVDRRCGNDLRFGPPWLVGAEIEVPCRYGEECTGHQVAAFSDGYVEYREPVAAVRGLAEASAWLVESAVARSPAGWRVRNTEQCGE